MSPVLSSYFFRILATKGAESVFSKNDTSMFGNFSEIVLTSEKFQDYQNCVNTLSSIMSSFLNKLNSEETSHVVFSRANPYLDLTGTAEKIDGESWENNILGRVYIADANKLKNESTLLYSISADILVDKDIMDVIARISGNRIQ